MPRRPGWVRLVAGAALVAVTAPAAGANPDPDAVALASDAGEAPILGAGVYDGRVPDAGETGFVALNRTIPGSTLWVAETLHLKDRRYGQLQYKAHPADDVEDQVCQTQTSIGNEYTQNPLITSTMMIDDEQCGSDADLVISTTNSEYSDTPLAADSPFSMVLWEEPPARDPSLLPPPAVNVDWTGEVQPARGREKLGTDFASAPELVNGRWAVRVAPRRLGLFRVPLDWGEHVEVGMLYQGPQREEYVPIKATLLTPLGGEARWAEAEGSPLFDSVSLSYPGSQSGIASPSISWRNREKGTANYAAFPGVYYVNLLMSPKDAPPKGADITVSVQVVKDREMASPYAEKGLPAPDLGEHGAFAAQMAALEEREREESAEDGPADDAPPWALAGLLFAGSAVMAVAGGVTLGKYRRSAV
jgi:hypothetical protein